MKKISIKLLPVLLLIPLVFSCMEKTTTEQKSLDIAIQQDWQIFPAISTDQSGESISKPAFQPDSSVVADMPATVMAALNRNNVYPDIFKGLNLTKVDTNQFKNPWWYRKTFSLELEGESYYKIKFEGLNYKANIWLNGNQIATSEQVEGCFRMFEFEVSEYLNNGENTLAVEIIPPQWGDLTIGFVDWNPWPPDNNMGIWRPVKLIKSGKLSVDDLFVKPELTVPSLNKAELYVSAQVKNHSSESVQATIEVNFEGQTLTQDISFEPNEEKLVSFDPTNYDELNIKNPRVWWPIHMGEPNLYELTLKVKTSNAVSSSSSTRFGIRQVGEYTTKEGHKGYTINGKKILIKGGGWVDDLFLDDSDEKVLDQIRYVKHMNLNTIRLEGFWGKNKKIYEYADEQGILIMIGWSCQWEWTDYCGRPEDEYLAIKSKEEIDEHSLAYEQQVKWLRNHPSIFLWIYGSDKLLVPELEKTLNKTLANEDGTRPILNSCGSRVSEVTGASGVKMNGPYSYVTPNYWYEDSTRGGAFGFNTETGPGIQPAPIQSVKRMIPEDHLWPIDSVWEYHLGRREFATFEYWMEPFIERYGNEDNVEDFTLKAQMANYEAMRAMFEAFTSNRPKTTGLIQWMLNSAMPNMQWQLYDWYMMPSGAFYATKKASQPLHAIYNYADKNIYISNEYYNDINNLKLEVKILDLSGKILSDNSIDFSVASNEAKPVTKVKLPSGITSTYFLDIRLLNESGDTESINFYWLSTEKDVLDFENSQWFITQNTAYADLKGINELKNISIESDFNSYTKNDTTYFEASLENPTEQVAFFVELNIHDKETDSPILPVFWEDNYVSLLPGENRTVSGYVLSKDMDGKEIDFQLNGWNIRK